MSTFFDRFAWLTEMDFEHASGPEICAAVEKLMPLMKTHKQQLDAAGSTKLRWCGILQQPPISLTEFNMLMNDTAGQTLVTDRFVDQMRRILLAGKKFRAGAEEPPALPCTATKRDKKTECKKGGACRHSVQEDWFRGWLAAGCWVANEHPACEDGDLQDAVCLYCLVPRVALLSYTYNTQAMFVS
jgi:hypothetical protein